MDLKAEIKKQAKKHHTDPYLGSQIRIAVIHIKGVIHRYGREHDPLNCKDCHKFSLNGRGPVHPDS